MYSLVCKCYNLLSVITFIYNTFIKENCFGNISVASNGGKKNRLGSHPRIPKQLHDQTHKQEPLNFLPVDKD